LLPTRRRLRRIFDLRDLRFRWAATVRLRCGIGGPFGGRDVLRVGELGHPLLDIYFGELDGTVRREVERDVSGNGLGALLLVRSQKLRKVIRTIKNRANDAVCRTLAVAASAQNEIMAWAWKGPLPSRITLHSSLSIRGVDFDIEGSA
jgi:hypothetical protein